MIISVGDKMLEKLKSTSLFSHTKQEILDVMIKEGLIRKQSYSKDATVHEQNSKCHAMDIVYSGELVAYSLASNGSETIVFEFEKGNIIGANLLFGNENNYPMNIYSTTDSTLFHISKSGVKELLKEYGFVMQFVKYLSMNSQGMNRKIAIYTRKSLRDNLTNYLLALSAEQKSKSVLLPITKKQLADYFGVQRPSLFRELKRMKEEGLIDIENRKIMVKF